MKLYGMLVSVALVVAQGADASEAQSEGPVLSSDAPAWTPDTTEWWKFEFSTKKTYQAFEMLYRTNDMVARLLATEGLCEPVAESCTVRLHVRFILHERSGGERRAGAHDRIVHYAVQGASGAVLQGYAHDVIQDGIQLDRMNLWLIREGGWRRVDDPSLLGDRLHWLVKDMLGLVLQEYEKREQAP